VNREARKERIFSGEQKGEGGGNSNCRWEGILIVADQLALLLRQVQKQASLLHQLQQQVGNL
jgi:hypothetical protein